MRHTFACAAAAVAAAALIAVQAAGAARPAAPVPALTPMLGVGAVVQVDIRARNGALVRRIHTHAGRVPQAAGQALDGRVTIDPAVLVLALAQRRPPLFFISVRVVWPGGGLGLPLYDPLLPGGTPTFQLPTSGAYLSDPTPELHFVGAVTELDPDKAPLTLQQITLGLVSCSTYSGPPATFGRPCVTNGSLLKWTAAAPIPVDTGQTIAVTLRLIFSEVAPPA